MPENNPYQSSLSGMWRSSQMPKPKRQGPLPLDQAYGVLQGVPNAARGLPGAVGASGVARPMSGLPSRLYPRSPQTYAFDEMYADISQIPGMARSLSGLGSSMSGAGGISGAGRGISADRIGQSIAGTAQAIPGSARNLSEAVGLSGSLGGSVQSPMSGAWQSSTVQPQPQGGKPLDGFVDMLGRIRSSLGQFGGAAGGSYKYRPAEPPASYATRPVTYQPPRPEDSQSPAPQAPPQPSAAMPQAAAPQAVPAPPQPMRPPAPQVMDPGVPVSPPSRDYAGSMATPPPTPQLQPPPLPGPVGEVQGSPAMGLGSLAQSRLNPGETDPWVSPGRSPLSPPASQPSVLSQLPEEFQERFRMRADMGLNQGVSEQDAVDYYIQNYQGTFRGGELDNRSLPPMSQPPVGASQIDPGVQAAQPGMRPEFAAASDLANDIAARRAAGMGVGRPPTEQEEAAYNAAVQSRLSAPGTLGGFMRGEVSARTEDGRETRRQAMDQSYLSKPMQGGGMPMADREARLSMLSPPGQRAQADSDFMARRAQTGSSADAAVREELLRQGKYTQEDLDDIAKLRNDPGIAMGGRRAVSLLAPGTSIRTPEGGFIMRGPDRETTPEDLERMAAGRLRDRLAPQERMDRVRAGRQAMMANRAAAERQQFEMATNPLANPMLVAGNPGAMSSVIQARSQMQANQALIEEQRRQFDESAPTRAAQIAASEAQRAEAAANERNLEAQSKLLGDPIQSRKSAIEGMIGSLQGATDPESVDLRRRLFQEYSSLMAQGVPGAAAGPGTGALMPPGFQAPLRDPETRMIPGADIEVQIKQHAANGLSPQEIVSKLEESGIDRASIIEYMRSVPDSLWQGMTRPESEMNTLRGIRPILGLEPDEGALLTNPWAPARPRPISMPMPPSRGGALMPPPQRGTR